MDALYGYVGFQKFCISCGASIKEPPEKESLEQESPESDFFAGKRRIRLVSRGIVGGIIFILLLILFRSVSFGITLL